MVWLEKIQDFTDEKKLEYDMIWYDIGTHLTSHPLNLIKGILNHQNNKGSIVDIFFCTFNLEPMLASREPSLDGYLIFKT